MMLKVINTFIIDPIDNGYNKQLTVDELSILTIWLAKAYHDKDIKPLWLLNTGVFATRDGWTIKLNGMEGAMSMDTLNKFLKAICDQAELDGKLHGVIYPAVDEYQVDKQWGSYVVKELDEILGYYDRNDRSFLPVALRYSEDLNVWYGIKGDRDECSDFLTTRFQFEDLTLGQI